MNTLKIKAMHPLRNHQKHTSLPCPRFRKKGTQTVEDSLDSPHHNDQNKDTTNHFLETGTLITNKQIHGVSKDNIEEETLLKWSCD